jgi:Holliday junction resolvase-like predicted endonuclease
MNKTTFDIGRQAEEAAVSYLQNRDFEILEQNWRTRWCEIDIVAAKGRTVYFVEVKYRHADWQGSGLEYITSAKLKQMRFATASWVKNREWRGGCQLAAIEVSGAGFDVTEFIDSIF